MQVAGVRWMDGWMDLMAWACLISGLSVWSWLEEKGWMTDSGFQEESRMGMEKLRMSLVAVDCKFELSLHEKVITVLGSKPQAQCSGKQKQDLGCKKNKIKCLLTHLSGIPVKAGKVRRRGKSAEKEPKSKQGRKGLSKDLDYKWGLGLSVHCPSHPHQLDPDWSCETKKECEGVIVGTMMIYQV